MTPSWCFEFMERPLTVESKHGKDAGRVACSARERPRTAGRRRYRPSAPRHEFRYVELDPTPERALAHAADPGLSAWLAELRAGVGERVADTGALGVLRWAPAALAVAGGDDGDPHLVVELLVEHRPEDDVCV